MIKLVTQPEGSRLCGQCVVAMILGISLERSIALVKKRGGTNLKQLLSALNLKPAILTKYDTEPFLPKNAILKVLWNDKKQSHWVLKVDDDIFDSRGIVTSVRDYRLQISTTGRITSYYALPSIISTIHKINRR